MEDQVDTHEDDRMRIKQLFGAQLLGVLATHEAGQPHTSLVAYVVMEDLKHVLFATPKNTRKYTNLVTDPRVAVLIDDRSNREEDFHGGMAVTVYGKAHPVPDSEKQGLLGIYLAKHPYLKDFIMSSGTALIKISVDKYALVSRFQEVREVYPT